MTKITETKGCGNGTGRCQCEQDSGYSLLVVKIANSARLSADVTEDFFLVPNDQYVKAVSALSDEQMIGNDLLYTVKGVKDVLTHYEVKFDHVINGHRFMFDEMEMRDCGCDCDGE